MGHTTGEMRVCAKGAGSGVSRVVIESSRVEFQGWLATVESSLSLIKLNRSCFVFRDLEFELDSMFSVFAKTQTRFG